MSCPYCSNTDSFTDPVPLCSGIPSGLGITVPRIQKCQQCDATLSPEAFTSGTAQHAEAQARSKR